MLNSEYQNPTRVIFGRDETNRVGKECKKYGKKILFIYGQGSIKKTGLYDKILSLLKEEDLLVYELGGIKPNPLISKVREGVEICKKENIDLVLAVGGGSVLDTGKIVALGAKYDGDPWDFFTDKAEPREKLPLACVLTLAATGSEMNRNAVISNEETQEKLAVKHPVLFPDFSILDPVNTLSVPREHTVYGIVDIMAHVFEQYFHPVPETPLQDRFAEGIMLTLIENTHRVLKKLDDYDARANIMWCSTLALNHLIEAGAHGDFATHQIEHELSALYDIPHGAGLAILFPQWMKYVIDVISEKFAQFAERVWGISREDKDTKEIALAGIERTKQWFSEIGAPVSLKEVGIGRENLERMAEHATRLGPLGYTKKLYKQDVLNILEMSL